MKDDLRDWLAVQIRLASLFHQRSIEATISRSFCDQQLGERVWDWLEDLVPGLAATRLSVFSAHPFLFPAPPASVPLPEPLSPALVSTTASLSLAHHCCCKCRPEPFPCISSRTPLLFSA